MIRVKYNEDHFLYVDKSGININETKEYRWSLKEKHCHTLRSGRDGTRLTMLMTIAVTSNSPSSLVVPLIFSGSCDRAAFLANSQKK